MPLWGALPGVSHGKTYFPVAGRPPIGVLFGEYSADRSRSPAAWSAFDPAAAQCHRGGGWKIHAGIGNGKCLQPAAMRRAPSWRGGNLQDTRIAGRTEIVFRAFASSGEESSGGFADGHGQSRRLQFTEYESSGERTTRPGHHDCTGAGRDDRSGYPEVFYGSRFSVESRAREKLHDLVIRHALSKIWVFHGALNANRYFDQLLSYTYS